MALNDILALIALIILAFVVWMFVPGWMIRRNIPKVIKMFRKAGAVGMKQAKAPEEVGFAQKSIMQRMFSRRDYKPKALEFLIQTNVVMINEEGKLYITDESIRQATWLKLKN